MRTSLILRIELLVWLVPVAAGIILEPGAWKTAGQGRILNIIAGDEHLGREEALETARRLALESPTDSMLSEPYVIILAKKQDVGWLRAVVDNRGYPESTPDLVILEAQIKNVLSNDPSNDVWWHNLSWVEWMHGERDAAIASIHRAIQLEPTDHIYRVTAGLFFEASGNDYDAMAAYEKAIEFCPRIVESLFYVEFKARNRRMAEQTMEAAVGSMREQLPDPIAAAKLARIDYDTGKTSEAESLLKESLQKLPSLGGAWLTLGMLEKESGRMREAGNSLDKAAYLGYHDSQAVSVTRSSEIAATQEPLPGDSYVSLHALRARTQYWTQSPFRNDIVPEGLLGYLTPINERENR